MQGKASHPNLQKRRRNKSGPTTPPPTKPTPTRRQTLNLPPTVQEPRTASTEVKLTRLSIKVILEEANYGPCSFGNVFLNSDLANTDTNVNDLCLRGVLTTNDKDTAKPILWSYTAFWGEHLTLTCLTQPTALVGCVKLQLAHDHPMSQGFEENHVELASRMTLFINGEEMNDNTPVGNFMKLGISTKEPYPNKITIKVEGKEPPTLTPQQRQKLQEDCENADFMIGEDKERPDFPDVIKVPDTRHDASHGFPILVMEGNERSARRAIWIAPTDHVTKYHDNVGQVYVNLGALTLKLCYANNVPIKIKYQDDLGPTYMISAAIVRFYQDPYTRERDTFLLNKRNDTPGYTFKTEDPRKPRTPCLTGHWDSFPPGDIKDVDENGDLTMGYTEGSDTLEVAFNENNEVRFGNTIHDDYNAGLDMMKVWWRPFVLAFEPIAEWMAQNQTQVFPTASLCVLHTSSDLQLGRLWYMTLKFGDMSKEEKKQFRPTQLRIDLTNVVQALVDKRLQKWDEYMTTKDELRRPWVTCLFNFNNLQSLPPNDHRNYCYLAQLLQYMTTSSLEAYCNADLFLSLRTLQRDEFLGMGEKPVPRYIQQGSKNKKVKTKKNATKQPMFMRQWTGNKRGRLSVVQNIPAPEDGTHTATIIPAVLNCMRGKFPTLK